MDILRLAREEFDYTVAVRRYLHEHPEAAPEEQLETMAYIERQLDGMEIPHLRIEGGGILGFIGPEDADRTLLLRADVDALKIQEDERNLRCERNCVSKKPGLMHACGHDAHMAMLLTEAKILKRMENELPGRIILLFEEGEEGGGNIKKICRYIGESGLRIDGCYAAHVRWDIPSGRIALCEGGSMCGQMRFLLTVEGQSGHGSRPDLGRSVIDCFHQIYSAWSMLRMNTVRPDTSLTWSACSLSAGVSHNVLPDHLTCEGTIRMEDQESGDRFWRAFHRAAVMTAQQCGCRAELRRVMYLLPLSSDGPCLDLFRSTAKEALGSGNVIEAKMWMASESFSYLSAMYPSVFAFIGIANEEKGCGANHHTAQFDLDEDGMIAGVASAVAYAAAFLKDKPDTSGFVPACRDMDALLSMVEEQPDVKLCY